MNTLFQYYRYEKKHVKCSSYRIMLIICLVWIFINAAADGAVASRSSRYLENVLGSSTQPQEFRLNLYRFTLLFSGTVLALYQPLFFIREREHGVPVLAKYLFAPVEIKKMRRAKTFLLLRGAGIFYLGCLLIYFFTAYGYLGTHAPFLPLIRQFLLALLFSAALIVFLLINERLRFRLYVSQAPSRM